MAKQSLEDIEPQGFIDVYATPQQQADRLISYGKGVYKDKVSGKTLYKFDEMPTAEVVGFKKARSISENLQRAYAKGIPSGTMSADMEILNAVSGGVTNWTSPSQILGATSRLIKNGDFEQFGHNLILGNNGIVSDNFAQKHPYWSVAANIGFDAFTGRSLHNINHFNKAKSLAAAIPYGMTKTMVEVPYNLYSNAYINDLIHPYRTIKAIKDNRYTPLFLNASKAKEALKRNQKALQNRFDNAYDFNKKIEANKTSPIDIDEQYKLNINDWNAASDNTKDWKNHPSRNKKPTLHIDPLKTNKGQKFYDANGYYAWNDVYIPSRTSKHILTDPNTNKIKKTLAHEIGHHIQDVIPKYRTIAKFDNNVGYYTINENDNLANKIFAPIKKNSLKEETNWAGSPQEVQAELAGLRYQLNNPNNYNNQPWYNKLYMTHFIANRFNITMSEANKMLEAMSRHSYAMGGHTNKHNIRYTPSNT